MPTGGADYLSFFASSTCSFFHWIAAYSRLAIPTADGMRPNRAASLPPTRSMANHRMMPISSSITPLRSDLAAEAVAGPLPLPTSFSGKGGNSSPFSMACMRSRSFCSSRCALRLCSDQIATMPAPTPMTMAMMGMKTPITAGSITNSSETRFRTPLILASPGSGCRPRLHGGAATRYTAGQYQARAGSHSHEAGRPGASPDCRHGTRFGPGRGPQGRRPPCRAGRIDGPLPPEGDAPGRVHRARPGPGRGPLADRVREGLAGAAQVRRAGFAVHLAVHHHAQYLPDGGGARTPHRAARGFQRGR